MAPITYDSFHQNLFIYVASPHMQSFTSHANEMAAGKESLIMMAS